MAEHDADSRLAALETHMEYMREAQTKHDKKQEGMDAKLDELLALVNTGKGAWWAGKTLGGVIVTLWTALISAAVSILSGAPGAPKLH